MKTADVNTVISWGLVIMGIMAVGGWIALSVIAGTSSGTEIPLAISSGLVGVLTGKKLAEMEEEEKKSHDDEQPPGNLDNGDGEAADNG